MSTQLDYDTRYERAWEFVDVVTGLWDSWDEDAFVIDKESGVFFDDSKMHVLDPVGWHFSVRGPLGVRRLERHVRCTDTLELLVSSTGTRHGEGPCRHHAQLLHKSRPGGTRRPGPRTIGPPLIEKFLSNGSLVQPVDALPIVRHAFHLLLPKTRLPSVAVRAFAGWIKASFVALGEDHDKPET